jgi:hypothetical protein
VAFENLPTEGVATPLKDFAAQSPSADTTSKSMLKAIALCFTGLDDGDLPFLLPHQLANVINREGQKHLIEFKNMAFDLFVTVSIGDTAQPSLATRAKFDNSVRTTAKAAGVRAVYIKHEVDRPIPLDPLDANQSVAVLASSHGQVQNWLQQWAGKQLCFEQVQKLHVHISRVIFMCQQVKVQEKKMGYQVPQSPLLYYYEYYIISLFGGVVCDDV